MPSTKKDDAAVSDERLSSTTSGREAEDNDLKTMNASGLEVVDQFYKGVIEDLRRRGFEDMASDLLKIQQKGSSAVAKMPPPQKVISDDSKMPPDVVSDNTSKAESAKISPFNSGATLPADTATFPPRGGDDLEEGGALSGTSTQRQSSAGTAVSQQSVPLPPALARHDGAGNGVSFPGAFRVSGSSQNFNNNDLSGSLHRRCSDSRVNEEEEDTNVNPEPDDDYTTSNNSSGENSTYELSGQSDEAAAEAAAGHPSTLEAVRVDDIMTVTAEVLDEAAIKRRLAFKGIGCFAVLIALVLSLSLTLQGGRKNNTQEQIAMTPTAAPTLDPETRFHLLREFFIDTFYVLYETNNATGNGRQELQDAFDDPESPQYLALEWMAYEDEEVETSIQLDFLHFNGSGGIEIDTEASHSMLQVSNVNITTNQDRIIQRYVLAVFFYATQGPTQWVDTFEFLSPGHECDWSGALYCIDESHQDRVSHIDLLENGLQGSIPLEISALIYLQSVTLSFNEITGTLPPALSRLTCLQVFDIAHNSLSGTIPEEYYTQWSELESLKIGENAFSGTISTSIGNLKQLKHLGAEKLYWTGTVPRELFQRATNLEFLEVSNQNIGFINDTLASDIGLCTNLESLIYHGVAIQGTIPTEIGRLSRLSRLQLASNHLTGTIPSEMGMLTAMTRLAMSVNALSGTLPTEFARMADLTRLELQNTFLTGDISFLCRAIEDGLMQEVNPLQFDMEEVTGCDCCTCCMY